VISLVKICRVLALGFCRLDSKSSSERTIIRSTAQQSLGTWIKYPELFLGGTGLALPNPSSKNFTLLNSHSLVQRTIEIRWAECWATITADWENPIADLALELKTATHHIISML
jgi:hypothetical protein